MLVAGAALAAAAPQARAETCGQSPAGTLFITLDCEDPLYNASTLVIDSVTAETLPAPHTRVAAHFQPTAKTPAWKVSFFLPPAAKWQGRFFQHVYPLDLPLRPDNRLFAFASGGMLVDVRGDACACGGYRADAGAAKAARAYAAEFYKTRRPIFGYVVGGSGGSFQTIAAMENTAGIWQGGLPYIMGTEAAFQTSGAVALARLVLKDKLAGIIDAAAPGGSGDIYAGLDEDQRAVLREVRQLGVPLRMFEVTDFAGFPQTAAVKAADPGYVDDFWSKPGYAGANPPRFLGAAKYDRTFAVRRIEPNGALVLDRAPDFATASTAGGEGIEYWVERADGSRVPGTLAGQLNGNVLTPDPRQDAMMAALRAGGRVRVNNLWHLAMMFYHRHAVARDPAFYIYDQFLAADGSPLYPQRPSVAPPVPRLASGGAAKTGRITGKLIVISNLPDIHAHPWQADWYSQLVRKAIGDKAWQDSFRIYFNDNAEHFDDNVPDPKRLIYYVPSLHQGLRDLVGWVERGVLPPPSTRYTIAEGQVEVPRGAAERRGFQPVVDLTSAGADRIEVAVNQPVAFTGRIAAPPGTGKVVRVQWYSGEGDTVFEDLAVPRRAAVEVSARHAYSRPGTYFPVLRAATQRNGDPDDLVQVQNLGRMRVIVR